MFFIPGICNADEQRLTTKFTSNNGKYAIIYKNKKWLVSDSKGSILYRITDEGFCSMTILVSDDGRSVVVLNDFMEQHFLRNSRVLWIYKEGKLMHSYQLTEIVKDTCNTASSIWHKEWCLNDFGFDEIQNLFSLSTYEFMEYSFDLESGDIISERRPDGFDDNTFILYGGFRKNSSETVTMTIYRYINGPVQPDNKMAFKTSYFGQGYWTEGIMISNEQDITPERYRHKIIINSLCNY